MTTYITKDGDTLDAICWQYYGRTAGVTELVLTVNRHLEAYDAVLPAGVRITLPPIGEPKNDNKIKLWQ